MNRDGQFAYLCNACGRCCHDKVITLAPYDVLRVARAAGLSTGDAVRRYTIRRGSLLRFRDDGACIALDGNRCSIHTGRPLACRLYPLGLERNEGGEGFVRLEPASGSLGRYSADGNVAEFLSTQNVEPHLEANDRYRGLITMMRNRIAELVDFERVEPREFRRRAIREALAESSYDPNLLIDALFDADCAGPERDIDVHVRLVADMIRRETDADQIAAAAVLLAVSLGYLPDEAFDDGSVE